MIHLREVPRASQQPSGLRSPGKLEGDGVRMLPGSTQVVLVEHRREGSGVLDGGWEQNRGGRSDLGGLVWTRFAWVLAMEIIDELRCMVKLSGKEPRCFFIRTSVASPAD